MQHGYMHSRTGSSPGGRTHSPSATRSGVSHGIECCLFGLGLIRLRSVPCSTMSLNIRSRHLAHIAALPVASWLSAASVRDAFSACVCMYGLRASGSAYSVSVFFLIFLLSLA